MSEKLEDLIKEMRDRIQKLESDSSKSTAKNTLTKGHNHSLSEVLDCPECGKLLTDKIREREKKPDEPHIIVPKEKGICVNCGEEIELDRKDCPECGGTYARKRE